MLTELTPLFKKPPLYTKTEIPFWDDEHISLQMLNAHRSEERRVGKECRL